MNACTAARGQGGNCPFPSCSLTRRSAGVRHVFVATSVKYGCFISRLRRGETAAVPVDLLSKPLFFRGRLAQLFFRRAALSRLAPNSTSTAHRWNSGTPADSLTSLERRPFHQGKHAQGRRRFHPASPAQSRAAVLTQPWHQSMRPAYTRQAVSAMHAAGRSTALLLVHRGATNGVIGLGVSRNRSVQWRGFHHSVSTILEFLYVGRQFDVHKATHMNQAIYSSRPTIDHSVIGKSSHTFARLMKPSEVAEATEFYPSNVRARVAGHWMLCGDVSAQMFQLLKMVSSHFFPTRVTGFRSSYGFGYGVLTHQVGGHQHRFVLCLSDPPVREFLASIGRDKVGFMLGDDNQPDALVLESPIKPSEFLPLLAMSQEGTPEERKEALLELPLVQEAMSNPLQVPSLVAGTTVQEVNVSLLLPSILDETLRIAMRNAVAK